MNATSSSFSAGVSGWPPLLAFSFARPTTLEASSCALMGIANVVAPTGYFPCTSGSENMVGKRKAEAEAVEIITGNAGFPGQL